MKIYSNRADKNVDCIRTSMRTEKHNSLHVTLNFRRTVGGPVTMEEETGSEVIINFTDTCELENFIMALTQLKEIYKELLKRNGMTMTEASQLLGLSTPQQLNNKFNNKKVSLSDLKDFLGIMGYDYEIIIKKRSVPKFV